MWTSFKSSKVSLKVLSNKEIHVYSLIWTTGWSTEPESVDKLEPERKIEDGNFIVCSSA